MNRAESRKVDHRASLGESNGNTREPIPCTASSASPDNEGIGTPWFALAVLGFFAGFVATFPLTNSDIWWHLASAREMFSVSGFLHTDPFSYTSDGSPWINIHWGFQCLFYGIHHVLGVEGMVAAKAVLYATALLVATRAVPNTTFGLSGLLFVGMAAYLGRYLVLVRPTTLTLLFMALFLFCLERYRRDKNPRLLWLLLFLQILWANVQGLFILGPVLILIYGVEEILRRREPVTGRPRKFAFPLIAYAPLFWIGCAIHPYGLSVLGYPFKLFGRINSSHANLYSENVSENIPLLALVKEEPGTATGFFIIAAILGIALALQGRKGRPAHWMLYLCFLLLALLAKRNLILFYLVSAPLFTTCVPHLLERVKSHLPRAATGAATAFAWVLLVWGALAHASVLTRVPSDSFLSPFRFPTGAVEYLQRHPVPGNVFNSVRHGGYLLWERYPPHQVLIDGRLILRTPGFFAEYLAILDHPPLFEGVQKKFDITHVLLPMAVFDRYRELAKFLYRDGEWRLVWTDGTAVLFVLDSLEETPGLNLEDAGTVQTIREKITRKWKQDPYLREEGLGHLKDLVTKLTGAESGI